jgi:hypothetical protein
LSAAAALLPTQHERHHTATSATAAGARAGAQFAGAGQLTWLASEIHGYTGVP